MRESTSLKLPSLEKGSSIFDYKVGKYQNCTLNFSSTQVNPHTGDWSHWNSLMENYVPPDIRLNKLADAIAISRSETINH